MVLPLRTIRWKLIISSLFAVGLPLVVFGFFLGSHLWNFYLAQLQTELRSKANHVAESVAPVLDPNTPDEPAALQRVIRRWRNYENMRLTVVDSRGLIRAATAADDVGTHYLESSRPGMTRALAGKTNWTVWKNPDYGYEDSMYVNAPAMVGRRVVGAVRVAHTLTQIQTNISRIRATLVIAFAAYACLIIVLTFILGGSIARPVEALNRSARIIAAGDLTHRVEVRGAEEVNQLAETLNHMTTRLQQLEGMRRQYVSNVSHELRTPLASIRGMAETLIAHGSSDPELPQRYLPRIIAQTERLARLASQLLDLAQIESGNLVGRFAPVDLREAVDDAVETCAPAAEEKAIRLEVRLPEQLPRILGDRDRLIQVFLNLVDNAVRHTRREGRVTVTAACEGDRVVARVEDTGCGIPREHLPHIFDRFYRVEEARSLRTGGTGLGLSIVRQIVEAHGGCIEVDSDPERGTCFTITLPAEINNSPNETHRALAHQS